MILFLTTRWWRKYFMHGFEIAEITCPTKYFDEASSINLSRSAVYGLGVVKVSLQYRLAKWGLYKPAYLGTRL